MDEIFFFGFLLLLFLGGPWIGLFIVRKRLRTQHERSEEVFSNLTQRVFELESTLREFQRTAKPTPPQPAAVTEVPKVEPQKVEPPKVDVPRIEAPRVAPPSPPPPPRVDFPRPAPVIIREPEPVREPAPPVFGAAEVGPGIFDRIRKSGGIEEFLGKNILNKIGIVLVVVGIAYLISNVFEKLGPPGKVLLGYTVSLAFLAAGIWFERSDRYRILARAGIAGGWALLFFTTYAMYHVDAARVLSSQSVDLVLMLAVALAMVWHTLRYDSQVVTGMAFLLAYSTVFISRVSVYSLSAGVVLAIGIVLIALWRNWFELEIFGILAGYLNHYFWLRPIIEPMGGHKHPFAEFVPSAGILICYWLIFRVSYVVRTIRSEQEEQISTVAGLLNSVLLMAILKYQSVHPEWAFWALLVFGAVEIALGQLPITKRRRIAFVVLTTIGTVLLVAAVPFRYSGAHVSVFWMLEAEALFLIGIWTGEYLFSRLGLIAAFATAGQMLAYDFARDFGSRIDRNDIPPDYRVGLLVLGVAAAVLYANAHYVSRRWSQVFTHLIDKRLIYYTSYAGAVVATAALYMAFPETWTVVAWGVFALALAIASRRLKLSDLGIQANAISTLALLRVIVVNFQSEAQYRQISLRLVTIGIVAGLFYFTSRYTGLTEFARDARLPDIYTWTASTLLAVLMWYELQPISVALGWCLFGVLLFEVGVQQKRGSLRWQGYLALVSAFLRLFFVNLNAEPTPGEFSARVYTIVPLAAAFFYLYTRRTDVDLTPYERWPLDAQSWMGTITVAALVRFELPADWVVVGWAALVFILLAIAFLLKQAVFQHQAVLLAFAVFFRACFHNFYARGRQPWGVASEAVIIASVVLFASLYFAFRLREKEVPIAQSAIGDAWNFVFYRPEQVLFFVPLSIITILLALEMRSGLLTVAWGVEAVVVFLFALLVGERSFRFSGLGLLLLCVGKIIVIDVWGLGTRDRILTFILMGVAALLVSFLYTRYSEKIKEYL